MTCLIPEGFDSTTLNSIQYMPITTSTCVPSMVNKYSERIKVRLKETLYVHLKLAVRQTGFPHDVFI